MKYLNTLIATALFSTTTLTFAAENRTRIYGPLETVIDCTTKSPVAFKFEVANNASELGMDSSDFELTNDSRLPKRCVANKINRFEDINSRYLTQNLAPTYIAETEALRNAFHHMNNVFPAFYDNKGIFATIFGNVQCLSAHYSFKVEGGFIYDSQSEADMTYGQSIGVRTPSAVWYLLNRDDGDQMAFLIDNTKTTTVTKSITSIAHLQEITGKELKITSKDPDMALVKYNKVWPCSTKK